MTGSALPPLTPYEVRVRVEQQYREGLNKAPYVARVDPGFVREFGTQDAQEGYTDFAVEVTVGDFVEGRGAAWSSYLEAIVQGYVLAVMTEGGLITVSRELAHVLDERRQAGQLPIGAYQIDAPDRVTRLDTGEVFSDLDMDEAAASAGILVTDARGAMEAIPETGDSVLPGVCPIRTLATEEDDEEVLRGFESLGDAVRRFSLPFITVHQKTGVG